MFAEIFDEYVYHADGQPPTSSQNSDDEGEVDNAAFEIPLNILIDCLNIFGTAGPATSSSGGGTANYKRWRQVDEDDSDETRDDGDNGGRGRGGGRGGRRGGGGGGRVGAGGTIETYFGSGTDKATSMRMSYAGAGYPLTLLMCVLQFSQLEIFQPDF